MATKTKRGGFRKNSGRNELGDAKKVPVTIYVPKREIEILGGLPMTREAALLGISWHVSARVSN